MLDLAKDSFEVLRLNCSLMKLGKWLRKKPPMSKTVDCLVATFVNSGPRLFKIELSFVKIGQIREQISFDNVVLS